MGEFPPIRELLSAYLAWCATRKEQPRIEEFAHWAGINRVTVYRWCRRVYNLPPSAVLRNLRLRRAETLLAQAGMTTTDVAYRAGFGSSRNLFRAFRRDRGTTPRGKST